jgi:hypothetical protein
VTYNVAAAPTIGLAIPENGAVYVPGQRAASQFRCDEGAGGPGIASCVDQGGHGSGSPIDTSSPGMHSFTVTARSGDGQTASSSVTYRVAAPPAIRLTFPESGASYVRGQHFVSEFHCDDGAGGPGITSCVDQRGHASDAFVDTSRLGKHVFTVNATSADGLAATAIARYTVVRRATLGKLSIRHGIITFAVKVPADGMVTAVATTNIKRSPPYGRSNVVASHSGKVPMIVTPSRAGKLLLQRKHRLTIRVVISYTPSGGLPQIVAKLTRGVRR